MKICIVYNAHPTGCSYYRLEMPNAVVSDNYPEFDFVCVENIATITDEALESVDLFLFNRTWVQGTIDQVRNVYKALTSAGAKVILDMDDYWYLGTGHIMYKQYQDQKMSEMIAETVRLADHVTCTTTHLAEYVKKLNPNITILPNIPYDKYQQFIPVPEMEPDPDVVKFGWFGGAQHGEDIEMLYNSMGKLEGDHSLDGKYRIYLGGWNDGNHVYSGYERIFSYNGKNTRNYGRIRAADIYSYVGGYNFVNVTMAPLRDTLFNGLKSELKVVEAGWMGKALICSEKEPYTDIVRHMENAYVVPYRKNDTGWYKAIKMLTNEPETRMALAAQLQKDVKERFDLDATTQRRVELYRALGRKKC